MGSSFLFTAHVPQAFVALFLLGTGGGCPDRNKDKKSACHSHKENGKRRLLGFIFSFRYKKGAACWPRLMGSIYRLVNQPQSLMTAHPQIFLLDSCFGALWYIEM